MTTLYRVQAKRNLCQFAIFLCSLCFAVASGADKQVQEVEQLFQQLAEIQPQLSTRGSFDIGVTSISSSHSDQLVANQLPQRAERQLEVEIWYPSERAANAVSTVYTDVTRSGKEFRLQGKAVRDALALKSKTKFPLVIFSHGYTGYRTIMFHLAEHLASHGYVVASIDHTDSRNKDIDFANNSGAGFLSTLLNRPKDQQLTLDFLHDNPLAATMAADFDNVGLLGYSMGGYGAINTVGGCYQFSSTHLGAFGFPESMHAPSLEHLNQCAAGREQVDDAWKAMIAIAPWGAQHGVHAETALGKMRIPSLFIAGEEDDISGFDPGVKSLFEMSGSKNKHLLVYENARHNIAAHPAPQVAWNSEADLGHYAEPAWDSQRIGRINQHFVLAFLDCYLKKNDNHCQMLPPTSNSNTAEWSGFPKRWNTGLRFYNAVSTDGALNN